MVDRKYLENPWVWIVGGGLIGAGLFSGYSDEESASPGLAANDDYVEQCLENRVMTTQAELSAMQNQAFCTCSAQMLTEGFPEGEAEYVAEHGRNSPEFMALRRTASENCLISARYVGAPDPD